MLYRNNTAIDTDIVSNRIHMELTLLHRAEREGAGSEIMRKELLPDAIVGISAGAVGSRRLGMSIADKIKHIPIIGGFAAWAVWILRVRRIARAVFQLEERFGEFDGRVQHALKSLEAASRNAGEQTAAVRREVMFQQRRLSRMIEMLGNDSASRSEAPPLMRDQRLDSLYEAFEEKFRGSRADIKQRLVPYLDRLKGTVAGQAGSPIVDIGCGRGEWLELLRENGLAAYGIDVNSMMVERAVSLGLDARLADLITHLGKLSDSSRSAITAFHVVEHLPFEILIDFLDEALRVLLPGGILILETPNPENMRVGATTFYNDPTHRNPILPEPLRFVVEHRGFSDVEIVRLHPGPESERLKGEGWNIAHLNALLYGPRDYAIVARRL